MLTKRAKNLAPSATFAIDVKAKRMRAEGLDVISFGVGEPDFDTPEGIKEAAISALRAGATKYTPAGGTDELRDAIVAKLKRDNALEYTREEVAVSCGSKHTLYSLAMVLFEEGDEVIIPAPYWVSFPEQVKLCDAKPVFVQT
ncbi:MAG: aminotransferase class I/II-fold pyridoxal phosphate-dependent enzyme, partial [candidate division NC10 bacterium]|nr:aminotransferase class I/II-fold pyridoxal phosphate-dependent enzyme [candidate division NC10 bacterium]